MEREQGKYQTTGLDVTLCTGTRLTISSFRKGFEDIISKSLGTSSMPT